MEGETFDRSVRGYRPKTFINEGAAKKVCAMARAAYEARRNKAKAVRFSATYVGWRQSDGRLWMPNILVPCEAPEMNLSAELAIPKSSIARAHKARPRARAGAARGLHVRNHPRHPLVAAVRANDGRTRAASRAAEAGEDE